MEVSGSVTVLGCPVGGMEKDRGWENNYSVINEHCYQLIT